MNREDFDNDVDGLAKFLMSGPDTAGRFARFPEAPPPTCMECGEDIHTDDYDNPMPPLCRQCCTGATPTNYSGPSQR